MLAEQRECWLEVWHELCVLADDGWTEEWYQAKGGNGLKLLRAFENEA